MVVASPATKVWRRMDLALDAWRGAGSLTTRDRSLLSKPFTSSTPGCSSAAGCDPQLCKYLLWHSIRVYWDSVILNINMRHRLHKTNLWCFPFEETLKNQTRIDLTNWSFDQWLATIETNGCLSENHCHSIGNNGCFPTIKPIKYNGSFGQWLATNPNPSSLMDVSKTIDHWPSRRDYASGYLAPWSQGPHLEVSWSCQT